MSGRIRVCRRDALSPDEVEVAAMPRDESGRPREALVVLDEDGCVRAYLNRCEHLPIPLDAGSRDFFSRDGAHLMCGTHGALFRRGDGFCIAGPCAGRSLLALPFRITDDGWVELEEV